MDIVQAIHERHAVRHYDGKPLSKNHQKLLQSLINQLNIKSGLHMQLVVNEPKAFGGEKAKVCNFTGCVNYLVIVGPVSDDLDEQAGYYGEQIVLEAQRIGINSCWVKLTFDIVKDAYTIQKGEKLVCVIALGYGTTQGKPHISKQIDEILDKKEEFPEYLMDGVKLALLAPTGKNQQGFKFKIINNDTVMIKNSSLCGNIDVGIVKYHFELGNRGKRWAWYKK